MSFCTNFVYTFILTAFFIKEINTILSLAYRTSLKLYEVHIMNKIVYLDGVNWVGTVGSLEKTTGYNFKFRWEYKSHLPCQLLQPANSIQLADVKVFPERLNKLLALHSSNLQKFSNWENSPKNIKNKWSNHTPYPQIHFRFFEKFAFEYMMPDIW